MEIPIEPACWRLWACSETPASLCVSASSYGLSKDVGILAVVVPELKLGKVQRQLFAAHDVIGADDSALEQTPKRFDVVGMDRAPNVLAAAMLNRLVRIEVLEIDVAGAFI